MSKIDNIAYDVTRRGMRTATLRDMSDAANWWADDEIGAPSDVPRDIGETKAALTVAFEAGCRYAASVAALSAKEKP